MTDVTQEMRLAEEAGMVGDLADETKRGCGCDFLFFLFLKKKKKKKKLQKKKVIGLFGKNRYSPLFFRGIGIPRNDEQPNKRIAMP
jgi:hypothetical protein